MARIRTIKPEFPHSESMGRVSRDARLTFIEMWTLADDSGRLRGNSRMLASLLFPYDDDAPALMEGWLSELERESCIVRYSAGGTSCIQICNWLNHQKIDKPSQSKLPAFDESSRILANPRERSSGDQGSRIKEGIKDQGRDQGSSNAREDDIRIYVDSIKAEYPPAARANWITAEKRLRQAVLDGAAWGEILDGVRRYAAYCKTTDRIVADPANWFGSVDRQWLQPWTLPKTKADKRLDSNLTAAEEFMRRTENA